MQLTYARTEHHQLPLLPGVYQFYDKAQELIYVGKAKNIRKRVGSYFSRQQSACIKTRKMVAKIHTIGFVLVNDEYDALLLENNLIKKHQPRYNVLLKDGKTYPYLCITNERFPRVIATRQKEPPLGRYFGPFISSVNLDNIQSLIKEIYPLRTCRYDLSAKNIENKKFKLCLKYHIGQCLAPCEGLQSEDHYNKNIAQITHLLQGNFYPIKRALKKEMLRFAKERRFEKAQRCKEKLQAVERYQTYSLLIHPRLGDFDVVGVCNAG